MKDSDDYITARHANPKTGAISPSLGTRTPGSNLSTFTPASPGEALKLRSLGQESPTANARDRHAYSRANESRNLSGAHIKHSVEPQTWHYNTVGQARGGAAVPYVRRDVKRKDIPHSPHPPEPDKLVHMPSAEEPQPFAYPGYSSEQIDALEHYRCKSPRVSSDGYDQRLLLKTKDVGVPHVCTCRTAEIEHCTNSDISSVCACPKYFRPYQGAPSQHAAGEVPPIKVRKRRGGSGGNYRVDAGRGPPPSGMPNGTVEEVTIISSPLATRNGKGQPSRTLPGAFPNCSAKTPRCELHAVSAKLLSSIDLAPRTKYGEHAPLHDQDVCRGASSELMQMLPPVDLVRPELAAVLGARDARRADYHRTNKSVGRSCSLGCQRDGSTGQCTGRRDTSQTSAAPEEQASLPKIPPQYLEQAEEFVISIITSILCYLRDIQLPKSDLAETLTSPTATVKEKAKALKAALSLAGHVLAIGMTLVLAWKVSAAVMQVVENYGVAFGCAIAGLGLVLWRALEAQGAGACSFASGKISRCDSNTAQIR
ncbi:unnamed protein product [Zymoseptoria tritici ST99CH_3D7]|uniref:Uncharacterized protein n=1 Tax=Zymoseptoria tritici (strain ST99CH_3D7) TaxID=1276538 RepID=A0A1X7RVC4_ZYMT9|nr:unnamed protein product [Zymoseptoria tritici ST99CH_3D7]